MQFAGRCWLCSEWGKLQAFKFRKLYWIFKAFFFSIVSMQSCGFQQLDNSSNATLTREMSEDLCKALAPSACFLSPWFLYISSRECTEPQELVEEPSFAAVVQLSGTILRISMPILNLILFPGMLKINCTRMGFTF